MYEAVFVQIPPFKFKAIKVTLMPSTTLISLQTYSVWESKINVPEKLIIIVLSKSTVEGGVILNTWLLDSLPKLDKL